MDTATAPDQFWLVLGIAGGFIVVFPAFWCFVVWMLSRASGWHRLARRHASGSRPVGGARHSGVTGMVGRVSYRRVLTLQFNADGFFLEVMALFRTGHPRLFIPWSEVTTRTPRQVLWWRATSLGIGDPVITTIAIPSDLVKAHAPN